MITLAVLLAASAAPPDAVDAERDFAAMAQIQGQWTAFRAFAAPEAVMFVPQPVNAQAWLKDQKNPPQSVTWWPARMIVSCDGSVAVTSGPWIRSGGSAKGYFTTVWNRQADGGWKWVVDHGDDLATPRPLPEKVEVQHPNCEQPPPPPMTALKVPEQLRAVNRNGKLSPDATLWWAWNVEPTGARTVTVRLWDGRDYRQVLMDTVAAE